MAGGDFWYNSLVRGHGGVVTEAQYYETGLDFTRSLRMVSVAAPPGDSCLNGYGFVSQKWWICGL